VQLGTFLASGHALHLHRADFHGPRLAATAARFFWAWMLGGVVLGGALGVVAGGLAFGLLRRRSAPAADPAPTDLDDPEARARSAAIAEALSRASRRYDRSPPRYRHYARFKYRLDPVYAALCAEIPAGAEVLDLGCGLGMLPIALAELGHARRAVGLDWDAGKIAAGQQAAQGLPSVELSRADLRTAPLPACDALTLVDVLHYYDAATQREVLGRAAAALRPGGRLLVRETDPALRGGARLTRLIERAAVRLGWNRGPRVTYRPIAELCAELAALGLDVSHRPLAATTHPGNVLLTATRPAAPG
jgi:SAM-dependent methyltransferase